MNNRLIKIAQYLHDSGFRKEAQQILSIATMTNKMKRDLEDMRESGSANRADKIQIEYDSRQAEKSKERTGRERNVELYGMSERKSIGVRWLKKHFKVEDVKDISTGDLRDLIKDLEILTNKDARDRLYDRDISAYEQLEYDYIDLMTGRVAGDSAAKHRVLEVAKSLIREREGQKN